METQSEPQHHPRLVSRGMSFARILKTSGILALAVVTSSALVFAGADQSVMAQTAPPAEPYVSDYIEPEPVTVSPLNGFIVASDTITGPSFSAKIDNHVDARPQFGLERTDLVYEELVEGGITRYVAVWFSDIPNKVGPVRSIRPMDPDIISPLRGIVSYSGGRTVFVNMMRNAPVFNAIHGYGHADTIVRTSERYAPHNVVADAQTIVTQQSHLDSPQQIFAFTDSIQTSSAVQSGTAYDHISIRFSTIRYPTWDYVAADGVYLRKQEGQPDMSASGVQLSATNVVTMEVDIVYDIQPDVPRSVMVGSGRAWVSTGGKTITATWSKPSRDEPIRFVDTEGVTVRLAPGNTWVELMPSHGSINFE